MSSVAMALASYGEKINGDLANPGNLNSWLNSHGGYADSDLIVWSGALRSPLSPSSSSFPFLFPTNQQKKKKAINSLGTLKFKEEVGSLSTSSLGGFVSQCLPVIANVRLLKITKKKKKLTSLSFPPLSKHSTPDD